MSKSKFTREWPSDIDTLAKDQEQFKSKVYYPQIRELLKELKEAKKRLNDRDNLIDKLTQKQMQYDKHQEKQQASIAKLIKRWARLHKKPAKLIG